MSQRLHAACRGLVLKLFRQHNGVNNPQLPIRPCEEILPAKTSEASSFYMTGSLRMRYSKLEEEQFRNLESRVKNVPRTFNIIGKLETRALSTKKAPAEDRD